MGGIIRTLSHEAGRVANVFAECNSFTCQNEIDDMWQEIRYIGKEKSYNLTFPTKPYSTERRLKNDDSWKTTEQIAV